MKLSKEELIKKFPCLQKFQDQKWMAEEAVKHDCNYKELPLKSALKLIEDVLEFIERNKFSNKWEEGFSVKTRLNQVKDLLAYFCSDTQEERVIKGTDISPHPQDPTY